MYLYIIAASETFNIEIFVQIMRNGKHEWIRYSRNSDCDHSIQFITIQHQDNHFSLIQNKHRPCNCTCREVLEGKINHKYKNIEQRKTRKIYYQKALNLYLCAIKLIWKN